MYGTWVVVPVVIIVVVIIVRGIIIVVSGTKAWTLIGRNRFNYRNCGCFSFSCFKLTEKFRRQFYFFGRKVFDRNEVIFGF